MMDKKLWYKKTAADWEFINGWKYKTHIATVSSVDVKPWIKP